MRGLFLLVLLVIILPTPQPDPSSFFPHGTGSGDMPLTVTAMMEDATQERFLLAEVCPGRPTEFVIITNVGDTAPINGLVISDGEGNVTFLLNCTLARGESVAIAANMTVFASLHPLYRCFEKGSSEVAWGGKFALADAGDEVILRSTNGTVLDVLVYGSSTYGGEGWSGPAVGTVPKCHALVRNGADTDGRQDWSVEPPGRSSFQPATYEAIVEPFSVPEDAANRLLREILMAGCTINCSVYELSDPGIVTALADRARDGLDVNVLIEGQPVGGLSNASKAAIATLQAARVDVRELCSADSYKRYDYLHCKYMVLDGRRTVIMSENWGNGLHGNRGWGACLDSIGLASYFDDVFAADLSGATDVRAPVIDATTVPSTNWEVGEITDLIRYRCPVSTLLSPDYSGTALHTLIEGAVDEVLVEQLSVDKDWIDRPGLLSDLISASARGVKVRLLMDSSWGGGDNVEVASHLNSLARSNGLDLEARLISPYHGLEVMHNKGLVVDDQVVVSSINWGDSALNENREAGAIIASPEVRRFFSDLFWQDWAEDPFPPTVSLPWTYNEVHLGEPVLLDGTNTTDNGGKLSYEWDINGDNVPEGNASSWTVKLPEGNNTIMLTVRDQGNNTATAVCWVNVLPAEGGEENISLAALGLTALFAVAVIVWKRIIRRERY